MKDYSMLFCLTKTEKFNRKPLTRRLNRQIYPMSVAPVAKILIKIRSAGATKVTTVYGEHGFQVHTVRMFGLRVLVNPKTS